MKTVPAIYKGNRVLELSDDIHLEENSRVIVLIPEDMEIEDNAWGSMTAAQFLGGFVESDSIYNEL